MSDQTQPNNSNTDDDNSQSGSPRILAINEGLEDVSDRDLQENPLNRALDQTEDEFKPSKLSRLIQLVVDQVKRNYNMDPTGEEYLLIVATSMDKGQSYRLVADSTEDQRYTLNPNSNEIWAKQMIEKEMMDMKMKEDEIILMAKQKLKDEQEREAAQRAKTA